MKITSLAVVCVGLLLCIPAFCDPFSYTETFSDTDDNEGWGTTYGTMTAASLFGGTYSGDGALHSNSGGSPGGYDYIDGTWSALNWYLIFADDGASDDNLAGNKDYSSVPSLVTGLKLDASVNPAVVFFFASVRSSITPTDRTPTDPTAANTATALWICDTGWTTSSSWSSYNQVLSDDNFSRQFGSPTYDTWSAGIGDVDLVGIALFTASSDTGSPELMVDNFTATPEPGLLLTMAPLAGFLGWRIRRSRGKKALRT